MKNYIEPEIKITFMEIKDIITNSVEGEWDTEGFSEGEF